MDDKNQQFSADVLEKHNYIKELIGDTKTGLQVLQIDDDSESDDGGGDEQQFDDKDHDENQHHNQIDDADDSHGGRKDKNDNQHQNTERDSGKLRHCEGVLPLKHRGRQQ